VNAREIRKLISCDEILEWAKPVRGGCWQWQGSNHNDGYAAWNVGTQQVKVHRASYLLYVGPIPRGKFVVHTCGKRSCVNPDHLKLVDYKGLYQHNLKNGNVARGERNGFSTLTTRKIRRIRQLADSGKYTHRQIGVVMGCHQSNISRILSGHYWAHVK